MESLYDTNFTADYSAAMTAFVGCAAAAATWRDCAMSRATLTP